MNRIEILECVANEEHEGHCRVATCLREVMTAEGIVFTCLHLIHPRFDIFVSLPFLHTGKFRCRRVGGVLGEVGLVIETVVEEPKGVSDAHYAIHGVVIDTSDANGRFHRIYVFFLRAEQSVTIEHRLNLILEELMFLRFVLLVRQDELVLIVVLDAGCRVFRFAIFDIRIDAGFLAVRDIIDGPFDFRSGFLGGCLKRPIYERTIADDGGVETFFFLHPFSPLTLIPTVSFDAVKVI